jgi:putative heme iron utilization protein
MSEQGNSFPRAAIARELMGSGGPASLATLDERGSPFASYVVTAPAADLSPLLLLSRLAVHSRNLERDPRASLLFVREPDAGSESMTAVRLTLTGRAMRDADPELLRLYGARHPDSQRYSGFGDFSIYRFEMEAGHLVAGFGRIVSLSPAEIAASQDAGAPAKTVI